MKPVAFREWQIDMNYCLCLDVMSERFFSPTRNEENLLAARESCIEVKRIWTQTN
jgi:hypothetical protein